jgi:hypothetical protein
MDLYNSNLGMINEDNELDEEGGLSNPKSFSKKEYISLI